MLIGNTRDGRLLAQQIEAQYPSVAMFNGIVATLQPKSAMVNYVTGAALAATLSAYATTADLSSYVTTAALNGVLSAYVTASALASDLANYATTASLGAYVTTVALTATLASYALQSWVSARTLSQTANTGPGGIVSFITPAGQFSSPPSFQFGIQAGSGTNVVYNVQQNGPVIESGVQGEKVYTVSAKVSASLAVTVLAVSVLGVQAAPVGIPVICWAQA